jgi:hypothetical protein
MRPRVIYERTYQYRRKNALARTYHIGYQVYKRNDGSYIYGYEVVQESSDGWFGSGACQLQFDGSIEQAEARVRGIIEERIEHLPDEYESVRFTHRNATDEGVVEDAWLIRRIYGYWPAFHDAKMLSVSLRQSSVADKWRTDMEMSIHHWGQDNPNWRGERVDCKLTFLFEDVAGNDFSTDNVSLSNWICDLRFSRLENGRIQIDLEPSSGFPSCSIVRWHDCCLSNRTRGRTSPGNQFSPAPRPNETLNTQTIVRHLPFFK